MRNTSSCVSKSQYAAAVGEVAAKDSKETSPTCQAARATKWSGIEKQQNSPKSYPVTASYKWQRGKNSGSNSSSSNRRKRRRRRPRDGGWTGHLTLAASYLCPLLGSCCGSGRHDQRQGGLLYHHQQHERRRKKNLDDESKEEDKKTVGMKKEDLNEKEKKGEDIRK